METRRLQAFIEIVDSGSITRAARNMRVAQPALTQQVNELERQFRAKLLTRSRSGVVATAAGLRLYRHAQIISQQLSNAIRDVPQELAGLVRIGVVPSVGQLIFPTLVNEAREHNSLIRFSATDGSSLQIAEKVYNRSLDIGLVFLDAPVEGVESTPIVAERLCIVSKLPCEPVFSNGDGHLSDEDLANLPMLLPPPGNIHRRFVDNLYAARGVVPNIVAEINSMSGLIAAVKAGLGMAVLPPWTMTLAGEGFLYEEIPSLERVLSICVAHDSGIPLIDTLKAFIETVICKIINDGSWPGARILHAISTDKETQADASV